MPTSTDPDQLAVDAREIPTVLLRAAHALSELRYGRGPISDRLPEGWTVEMTHRGELKVRPETGTMFHLVWSRGDGTWTSRPDVGFTTPEAAVVDLLDRVAS